MLSRLSTSDLSTSCTWSTFVHATRVRTAVRSLCLITQTHANVSVRVLTVCIPGKSRTTCVLQVVVPPDGYLRVELDLGSCVTNE